MRVLGKIMKKAERLKKEIVIEILKQRKKTTVFMIVNKNYGRITTK